MKKPDHGRHYKPDPEYLRRLIKRAGHTQQSAALEIGISERTLSRYLAHDPAVYRSCPYTVQYALEGLAFGDDQSQPVDRGKDLSLS